MMTKKKYNESPDSIQTDELSLDIGLVADKFAASMDEFKFLSSKAHAILAPLNLNRSQNFYFSDISQTILKLKQNIEKIKDIPDKYNNAFTSRVLHDNYFSPEQTRQIKSAAINGYLIERKTELDKGFLFDESVIDKFRSLNSQFNTQLEECIQRIDLKFNPLLLKEKHFNKIRWYNIEIKTSFWSKLHNLIHNDIKGNPIYENYITPETEEEIFKTDTDLNHNDLPKEHPLSKEKLGYIMHDLIKNSHLSMWEITQIDEMDIHLEIKVEF